MDTKGTHTHTHAHAHAHAHGSIDHGSMDKDETKKKRKEKKDKDKDRGDGMLNMLFVQQQRASQLRNGYLKTCLLLHATDKIRPALFELSHLCTTDPLPDIYTSAVPLPLPLEPSGT